MRNKRPDSCGNPWRAWRRAWVVGVLALTWASRGPAAVEPVNFSREVLPLLSDRCFYCHGPDEKHRKADLRLDVESAAKAPGKHGTPIVPGRPAGSLVIQRILAADPDELMPPPKAHKELTAPQKALLQRWVAEGAPWGRHWAFTPLERPRVPGGGNPIDAFVGARLAREGMSFSPEADRRTLLRRASLDLTGLPPTPEEMAAWLADTSPDAWERQVDRLLASRAYGERMAWDWMEAARYADSNGYQGDATRTMWPWRDWVVRAFNQNLPWDEFTVWQLAGDLLPNPTDEQRLATGFLRNHPINGEGGRIPEENRVDYVMDMTETVGTVWLALTLNCCRCHDHKFDPLTNQDYYRLSAFFNQTPVDGGGGSPQTPPVMRVPDPAARSRLDAAEAALAKARASEQRERAGSAARRPAWEAKTLADAAPAPVWSILQPLTARAARSTLTIQPDHTLLNSGATPDTDDFEVTVKPGPGQWTGLRLDALRHPSMKHGSLSRIDSGNFVLTSLRASRREGTGAVQQVSLKAVAATFEQGPHQLAGVVDDDKNTGWGVWDGRVVDRSHAGVLRFDAPLATTSNTVLTVQLRHESRNVGHVMGHFRLSLTADATPRLGGADPGLVAVLKIPETNRTSSQRALMERAWEESDVTLAGLRREITRLETERREITNSAPLVMVMADQAKPRKTFVLDHGLYNKQLAEVTAGLPPSLAALPPDAAKTRLDLARWIVSRENPLMARVTVNRFWQMLWGAGLVKSAEDFGVQSEFPVQAELLDWLAAEFRDSGWDVKRLLRWIVTSRTWRQSSRVTPELLERDPFNRLFTRGARHRMPSWMIRDQALAASGLLRPLDGGAPVKPWQPGGVWEEATFGVVKYTRGKGSDLRRRSLYTFWRRIVGPTMFFDTGSRLVCSVKPLRTNTPLHALATANDVTYVECARALAQAVATRPDPAYRLDEMMQRVLGRPATPGERSVLLAGFERHRERFAASPEQAQAFLGEGEDVPAKEARTPEFAAWTLTALTVLNMDETLNRE